MPEAEHTSYGILGLHWPLHSHPRAVHVGPRVFRTTRSAETERRHWAEARTAVDFLRRRRRPDRRVHRPEGPQGERAALATEAVDDTQGKGKPWMHWRLRGTCSVLPAVVAAAACVFLLQVCGHHISVGQPTETPRTEKHRARKKSASWKRSERQRKTLLHRGNAAKGRERTCRTHTA